MNFQGLIKIESHDWYFDVAMKKAKTKTDEVRSSLRSKTPRLNKSKTIEIEKIRVIDSTIRGFFDKIVKNYPSFDELPEFYKQLAKLTLELELVKKSLGGISWANKKIREFSKKYEILIKKTQDLTKVNRLRNEYLGRIGSVLKQVKKELSLLEETRKTMKAYPTIKTELKTLCIAGFPNVGKSTLLAKLTSSTPEINTYAFTTKRLLVGYLKKSYHKVQLIDTPGTLNRVDKMNEVEIQAYLAMRYVADSIIYVFDLTEEYPIKEQLKLYKNVKKLRKPIFCYLSKTDILDKELVDEFKKENKELDFLSLEDLKELKKIL
ncbi:GTP-binding protein [Candidatus Woesearchaeota archaeon]|nr:GTP-binding protein [Candidatus Woesearchaeota archaeon]